MAMTAPFQEQAESAETPQEAALAASEHPAADAANTDRTVSDFQAMEVDNARLRAQLAAYRVLEASRFDDPYAAAAAPASPGAGSVAASMAAAASPAAQRQAALQASAMMASVGEQSHVPHGIRTGCDRGKNTISLLYVWATRTFKAAAHFSEIDL